MQNRHLSRHARDRFTLDSLHFPDLTSAKTVASQMKVSPGDLYALGLIDEALRILIERHSTPTQMTFASSFLDSKLGAPSVRETQVTFVSEFPTKPVYEGKVKAEEYLAAAPPSPTREETEGQFHRGTAARQPAQQQPGGGADDRTVRRQAAGKDRL